MSIVHALAPPDIASWSLTEQQTALDRAYTDRKIGLLRVSLPMGIVLLLAFAPWDYAMSPETTPTTVLIRLFIGFLLLCLWLGRSSELVRKWHDWLVCGLIALAGVGVAVILSFIPGGFGAASGGIALVIMFGSGAVRMPAFQTILASTVIIAATALFMHRFDEPLTMILSTVPMLVSFGVLGLLYNVANRKDGLDILASQSRLLAEKQQSDALLRQVTTMRAERLTWLENLARFLRHELSNQIVAVSTSIDLAKSDGSQFGSQTYLDRAQRSLNRMRGLVSSATEATSLEAALAIDAMERVDWSGVVVDRVSSFQQLHPSRNFTLRLRPALSVDGNEERLAQLLDKLLSNALEHSSANTEIRVGLRRADDDWLELTVENEGDALPEDKERIFEAFVSSQKTTDNLGLGLFVAQSIALNHGGEISAEDFPEGRGARFVIGLPEARKDVGRLGADDVGLVPVGRVRRSGDQLPPQ